MSKRFYFLLFFCIPVLQAQTVIGTVNGKPIPDTALNPSQLTVESRFVMLHGHAPTTGDQPELTTTILTQYRCIQLNRLIHKAAFANAVQQFGVVITPQDIKAAQESANATDAPIPTDNATTILAAISAVQDQKKDPNQVWDQMQISRFYANQNAWLAVVYQTSTPAGRAGYESYWRTYIKAVPPF